MGFLAFSLYHLLMYFRFYPGIGEADFILPFIIKGIGIGFLYLLSALYISENVPKNLSTSRMMSGIIARVVFALILGRFRTKYIYYQYNHTAQNRNKPAINTRK